LIRRIFFVARTHLSTRDQFQALLPANPEVGVLSESEIHSLGWVCLWTALQKESESVVNEGQEVIPLTFPEATSKPFCPEGESSSKNDLHLRGRKPAWYEIRINRCHFLGGYLWL